MPPIEGAERQRFREQAQRDYTDFAMIGDAEAELVDGILTLRIDLRPPEDRGDGAAAGAHRAERPHGPQPEASSDRLAAVVHPRVLHPEDLGRLAPDLGDLADAQGVAAQRLALVSVHTR